LKYTKINESYHRFSSTGVWQKWRFSAPQTHLWLIKVWFSASTFVVKIATFAKRQTVMGKFKKRHNGMTQTIKSPIFDSS
jgi:hypothetical protein